MHLTCFLGKEEVPSSILGNSSKPKGNPDDIERYRLFVCVALWAFMHIKSLADKKISALIGAPFLHQVL